LSDPRVLSESFEADLSVDLRPRLRALSDRVPRVPDEADPYRIVMHRLGVEGPAPAELALRDRLVWGGYRSRGAVPDACLIALVETGVPVWITDDVEAISARPFVAPPAPSGSSVTAFGFVLHNEGTVREALWVVRSLLGRGDG
jgi:hypothetical protein